MQEERIFVRDEVYYDFLQLANAIDKLEWDVADGKMKVYKARDKYFALHTELVLEARRVRYAAPVSDRRALAKVIRYLRDVITSPYGYLPCWSLAVYREGVNI